MLAVLLVIEVFADRIAVLDSANDVLQTFIRPTAGAILFASSSSVISDIHPVLALICGLLVAGGVHAVKATVRPVVTATSGGVLNPAVSTVEDVAAVVMSVLAILVPLLAAFLLGATCVALVWWLRRRRRRGQEAG